MRTLSLPRYAAAFIATIYTRIHPQARQARAMSVGEMTDQDFPDRPNYGWLQAHEDNSLPAEYRPGARLGDRYSVESRATERAFPGILRHNVLVYK